LNFGSIEGVKVGDIFESRKALSESGVHAPTMAGICGREQEGACSIVLSGGYKDDRDYLNYIKYTGHGGQDSVSGMQVSNQEFKRGNQALKLSSINSLPVRVTRGFQVKDGPPSGYRYDGLYVVSQYERIKGSSGFYVCRFHLNRLKGQKELSTKSIQRNQTSKPRHKSLKIEELAEYFYIRPRLMKGAKKALVL